MTIAFNEPYIKPSDPQTIRFDFYDLMDCSDQESLLTALANYISSDQLAEFIDDRCMGRV